MYRTQKWTPEIKAVEVIRSTAKTVTFLRGSREAREARNSEHSNWHNTWEDARQHLLSKATARIVACENEIERLQGRCDFLNSLTDPTGDNA